MTEEVRKCLANVQYGGSPCVAMCGIGGQENFVFNDEEPIVSFLGKNENRKADDTLQYRPITRDFKIWRLRTRVGHKLSCCVVLGRVHNEWRENTKLRSHTTHTGLRTTARCKNPAACLCFCFFCV